MAITISGLKTGMFQHMSYQEIATYPHNQNVLIQNNQSLPEYD
jgi:hypothetical protein